MNEKSVRAAIRKALRDVVTVDPHCHMHALSPGAATIADILLYHHVWIELVSSGMPQNEVSLQGLPHEIADPGIPPLERVLRARKHFGAIRNTVSGMFLKWILKDLFEWDDDLAASDMEKLQARVEKTLARPGWAEEVLGGKCGIGCSITVEDPGQDDPTGRFRRAAETLGLVNIVSAKKSPQQILRERETQYGRDIVTAQDYRDYLALQLDGKPLASYRFLGAWVVPDLSEEQADDASITAILRSAREGRALTREDSGRFSTFALSGALEHLRSSSLRTIQVIVGADVLLPHRSITRWSGSFAAAMARMAGRFEDFRFDMSTASEHYLQDTAILAKHVPNISVTGYWWHTLYPHFIRKALEVRLDIVPAKKITAFFSDAYHCEWCYPKIKLVKGIVENIMAERVLERRYDVETAEDLIRTIFHDSPSSIYGLDGS